MRTAIKSSFFLQTLILIFFGSSALVLASSASNENTAVLPSIDQSQLNFAAPLQKGLVRLLNDSRKFKGYLSNRSLASFKPEVIQSILDGEQVNSISFALLEPTRISVFFFHRNRPKEFIAQSELFSQPKELEEKFKIVVQNVLNAVEQEQYSFLPGQKDGDVNAKHSVYKSPKLESETRQLFREFSSISDSPFSLGTQIGMARFSAGTASTSTVIFGLSAGYQLDPNFSLEVGGSVSSYVLGNAGIRYSIPVAEKVVRFSLGLDVATVMANLTRNNTDNTYFNSYFAPEIKSGTVLLGPGFFFDIPLLGATMRGDLRFYSGSTSIFIGTYGFVFYL